MIEWLTYFGITPQQITPLVLVLGLAIFFSWRYFWRDIKQEVTDLHNASREMQIHLTSRRQSRFVPMHQLNKLVWAGAGSPFELNEKGMALARESGIETLVETHRSKLMQQLEKQKPSTGFDVEQCSFRILNEFVDQNKEAEKTIKDFIFNNPVFQGKEVGLADVFFVGGLILRDAYLRVHPELRDGVKQPVVT